jgi:hypothetical protein
MKRKTTMHPASSPPAATYHWHHDVRVNGAVYPLRNKLDKAYGSGELSNRAFGFTPEQSRVQTAVHELGHALVWLHHGVHVKRVSLRQEIRAGHAVDGGAETGPVQDNSLMLGWALGLVAGERAVDRWLLAEGLWTPSRAAWAELSAKHDRDQVLTSTIDPRPAFGTGGADYADLHELADQALAKVWERLLKAVPVLLLRKAISGAELARLSGLTNRRT